LNSALASVYDGDGNRVSETAGSTTTKYLIDDLNPTGYAQILDELTSGSVTRFYSYGRHRISEDQLVGSTWTPSFYGYDGHGNTRFLANTSGSITDTYTYDAFGMLIASTGTTSDNFRYSGEWLDPNLSFYNLRARYYNPLTGRFETMDPAAGNIFEPARLHRYVYTKNNPINAIDPNGLDSVGEYLTILKTEVLPAVVYAARLVCYFQGLTILSAESLYYVTNGEFFRIPYYLGAPCVALGIPFPPQAPGGL